MKKAGAVAGNRLIIKDHGEALHINFALDVIGHMIALPENKSRIGLGKNKAMNL